MPKRSPILLLTILVVGVVSGQDTDLSVISCPGDSLVARVPGGEMEARIWHPRNNTVYFWDEELLVVDCATDSVVGSGRFSGGRPAVVDTIDDKLYASGYSGLGVYDCARNERLPWVNTYGRPAGLAWHPERTRLYVAAGKLMVIDCVTDTAVFAGRYRTDAGAVCLLPGQGKVYFGSRDTIWVMDITSESMVGHSTIPGQPRWMELDPEGNRVYCIVSRLGHDSTLVIDPDHDSVLYSFPIDDFVGVEWQPVCLSTRLNRLYIGMGTAVDVYDCIAGGRVSSIFVDELSDMVLDTVDQKLYTCADHSDHNFVRVIDCSTNALIDSVQVAGMEPYGLVWVPPVNKVYCGASTLMHAVSETPLPADCAGSVQSTICRGVLRLPGRQEAVLLDIAGRRVMSLQPGPNDIRHVAPGVYFVVTPSPLPSGAAPGYAKPPEGERRNGRGLRSAVSGGRSAVRKIVIQK